MRIGRLLLFSSVLAAAGVEPSLAQDKSAAMVTNRVLAGEPGPDGWIVARATKGDFGMKLPVKYNDFSVPVGPLTTGGVGEVSILGGEDSETGARYTMICTRYVSGTPTLLPELTKGRPITHQKCNGYAGGGNGTANGRKTEGLMHAFILPKATCLAIIEYPIEFRGRIQALIPKFFDSIDLPGRGC